ncbi:MAG: hypothetical protein M1837_006232 [Sclerophora amabilis]|nr:MAG: hypothetical protein M1837_006232 [Sclerophora amabilis]
MSSPITSTSSSDEGAAYPWILEHILSYPGTYEISLRNMYALNSSPRAQHLPQQQPARPDTAQSRAPSSTKISPVSTEFPTEQQQQQATALASAQHFKANLMSQMSQLPTQPCSLPPAFVTAFVRRCFPEELELVDFPQALASLDYTRDLEARRRKELAAALRSLGIDKSSLGADGTEKSSGNPLISSWVRSMDDKERKVQALYTQVYIGIRRWMLINEMSLLPFNKSNSLALLNTLYPPTIVSQPTQQLTPAILQSQRDGFFRYIKGVEKNGRSILENVMAQGRRPERNDTTGWPSVRETLDLYLRAANGMIDECSAISSNSASAMSALAEAEATVQTEPMSGKSKKFDSGVSFNTSERSSTSSITSKGKDKPLPPSPGFKGTSTLEKIARELRRFRDRKKVEETVTEVGITKLNSIKKMKSTSALADLKNKNRSFVHPGDRSKATTPVFDLDEEARKKAIANAINNPPKLKSRPLVSHEV